VLSESELSQRAAADSLPMKDAFSVLFFVSVGMLFDPTILLRDPLSVLAVLLIILLGKSAVAFALVRAFGYSTTTALTISASLAQIGEFSFVLASLGVALGILPVEGRDLVLACAILSIALNPLAFLAIPGVSTRLQRR
jgi:CPA2 family monovalent cation:H+ antiporter-2